MINPTKIIYKAIKRTLSNRNYFLTFISISILFLAIVIFIPVFTIPGNDILFQLGIFTYWNYILMFSLSILISLMISMQIYDYNLKKSIKKAGGAVVGGFSGFIAGVFGTASCASCVAAIFGFLGAGTVFFLIQYQWYIVGISLIFILLSICLNSLSIERGCKIRK